LDSVNFVGVTGIEIVEVTSDEVFGRLPLTESHHQPYGVVHGGVYCTFVETLASCGGAAWAIEQGMAGAVGISNQTDFHKATGDGVLIGKAKPVHRGRTQQVWRVEVTRESDGKLAASGQVRLHNLTDLGAF
jgi:uncharacterized protein (TIGR00369 family)